MAWHRQPVSCCPIVEGSMGVVMMEEWVIAELVGASSQPKEWAALFLGEADEKWLRIWVNNLHIPKTQLRTRAGVVIPEDWKPTNRIAPEIVGVVHLHPGAHLKERVQFSSIDTGPGGLNERWPMSMVIGRTYNPKLFEAQVLGGIDYEIYGRRVLPCGAPGTIEYTLVPTIEGLADPEWPFPQKVIDPEVKPEHKDLGDCSQFEELEGSTRYMLKRKANCGLIETELWHRSTVFGSTGEGILDHLPEALPEPKIKKYEGAYGGGYNQHDFDEWDREGFIETYIGV